MKNISFLVMIIFAGTIANAQVAINNNGNPPDTSSILDISSNNKGLLLPRMDSNARKAMANVEGMVVYDIDAHSIFVNDGIFWRKSSHYIGENFGGGVVFWIDTTGEHGLIAAKNDVTIGCDVWTLTSSESQFAVAPGIYSGEANTILIIALDNVSYRRNSAAWKCYNYTVNEGESVIGGWYLPSKEEAVLMIKQKAKIGGFPFGSCSSYWWSSTNANGGKAYAV
jgi:hypothetical protein